MTLPRRRARPDTGLASIRGLAGILRWNAVSASDARWLVAALVALAAWQGGAGHAPGLAPGHGAVLGLVRHPRRTGCATCTERWLAAQRHAGQSAAHGRAGTFSGDAVAPHLDAVAACASPCSRLAYLYDGDATYEAKYCHLRRRRAACLCWPRRRPCGGASTAIPLADETDASGRCS